SDRPYRARLALLVLLAAAPPAVGSSARGTAANNLKQIVVAINSYQEAYGRLPTDIVDRQGRPLLSWRVAILPYIEQDNLYKQFRLDEPWDSPLNQQLIARVPKVYRNPWRTEPDGPTGFRQPPADDR